MVRAGSSFRPSLLSEVLGRSGRAHHTARYANRVYALSHSEAAFGEDRWRSVPALRICRWRLNHSKPPEVPAGESAGQQRVLIYVCGNERSARIRASKRPCHVIGTARGKSQLRGDLISAATPPHQKYSTPDSVPPMLHHPRPIALGASGTLTEPVVSLSTHSFRAQLQCERLCAPERKCRCSPP